MELYIALLLQLLELCTMLIMTLCFGQLFHKKHSRIRVECDVKSRNRSRLLRYQIELVSCSTEHSPNYISCVDCIDVIVIARLNAGGFDHTQCDVDGCASRENSQVTCGKVLKLHAQLAGSDEN
jgi:hypothetical protein